MFRRPILSRQALQRRSEAGRGLFHVLSGEAGDERPATRADLNQAFGSKLLQRAPHGSEADSELAGQLISTSSRSPGLI